MSTDGRGDIYRRNGNATESRAHQRPSTAFENSAAIANGIAHLTARKLMRCRGELDVNEEAIKETPIRVAFPIDDEIAVFPASKRIIGMLACFVRLKNSLAVKSGVTGTM